MNKTILTFKELNKLKDTIYATEVAHGFHDEKHTVDHELGMVLSEIGEAIDADRNPNAPVPTQKTIDEILKLPLGAFIAYFNDHIKGSVVEELADVAMWLLDLAGSLDVDATCAAAGFNRHRMAVRHNRRRMGVPQRS